MRTSLVAVLSIGLLAAGAAGDEITLGRVPLPNVRITSIDNGKVMYLANRREQRETDLSQITAIKLDRYPKFAQSVAKIADQPADAAADLRGLLGSVEEKWLKPLIRLRLSEALDRAGRFDQAIQAWSEAVADDNSAYFIGRLPRNVPTDAAQRKAARAAAKGALADARNARVKAELEKVVKVLDDPDATLPEPEPTPIATPSNGGATVPSNAGPARPGDGRFNPVSMRLINNFLSSQRYDLAIAKINEVIDEAGAPKPELYYNRGLAETGAEQPAAAAASFLRVAVVFGDHELAGDSFVRAGEAFKTAGRADLARRVWQAALDRTQDRAIRARLQDLIESTPAG